MPHRPDRVTITAKTGPDKQVTSLYLEPCLSLTLNFHCNKIEIDYNGKILEFDLESVTSITDSISANGRHTVVIS